MSHRTLGLALLGILSVVVAVTVAGAQPPGKKGDAVNTLVVETAHMVRAAAEGDTFFVNLDNVSYLRFDSVNKKLNVQFVDKTSLQLEGAKAEALYKVIAKQSYVAEEKD